MRATKFLAAFAAAFAIQSVGATAAFAQTEQASADDEQIRAAAKVVQRSVDAWRARNFEGWLANYSADVVVNFQSQTFVGRDKLRSIFRPVFDMNLPSPEIVDSGWTGEKIYVRAREFGPDGAVLGESYQELEVRGGKITSVMAIIP